jgi:hypothetical protein
VTSTLETVLDSTSRAITAGALIAGLLTVVTTRRPALALSVFLDLLVAAGLLRLAGDPSWQAIATAAAIIALRRLIGFGLRAGGPDRVPTAGQPPRRRRSAALALHRWIAPAWRR